MRQKFVAVWENFNYFLETVGIRTWETRRVNRSEEVAAERTTWRWKRERKNAKMRKRTIEKERERERERWREKDWQEKERGAMQTKTQVHIDADMGRCSGVTSIKDELLVQIHAGDEQDCVGACTWRTDKHTHAVVIRVPGWACCL